MSDSDEYTAEEETEAILADNETLAEAAADATLDEAQAEVEAAADANWQGFVEPEREVVLDAVDEAPAPSGATYSLVDQDGNVLATYPADEPFGIELAEGQSVIRND